MRNLPTYNKSQTDYNFLATVVDDTGSQVFCSDSETITEAVADIKTQMEEAYVSTKWRNSGDGYPLLIIPLFYEDGTYADDYEWAILNEIKDNRTKAKYKIINDDIEEQS